jgi:hypothetical protein
LKKKFSQISDFFVKINMCVKVYLKCDNMLIVNESFLISVN